MRFAGDLIACDYRCKQQYSNEEFACWHFPHQLLEVLVEEENEQLDDLQQSNLTITIRNLASVPSGKQRTVEMQKRRKTVLMPSCWKNNKKSPRSGVMNHCTGWVQAGPNVARVIATCTK